MKRFIQLCMTAFLIGVVVVSCGRQSDDMKLVTVNLSAPGMHCNGCVETLETTFKKLAGVDSVRADLDTKKVLVIADTAKASVAKLNQLIERLGFSEPIEEEML